jgi:S1-C subfamily serine protease
VADKRAFPRLPDWLIYLGVAALLLWVVVGQREDADAPAPPPPVPGEDAAPLDPDSPFNAGAHRTPEPGPTASGAAFSVSRGGVWVTAGHVVRQCRRVVLMVAEGRGVAARVVADPDADLAVLTTEGGAPALPLADVSQVERGMRGFHVGFPRGKAGELTSRFVGHATLPAERRGKADQPVLAWAETGRTEGAEGALYGLSGAPVLDHAGRVVGVTLGEAPRRGRLYTTGPEAVRTLMTSVGVAPAPYVPRQLITTVNYGRAADDLRRSLSVAQVFCFKR